MTGGDGYDRGHLFLVHGEIEKIVHDAVIIPTDSWFVVEPHWHPLLSGDSVDAHQPPNWRGDTHGRSPLDESVWFVDSVFDANRPTAVVDRLRRTLTAIASAGFGDEPRGTPRIALPLIGTGKGGQAHQIGIVIEQMLDTLSASAAELAVDIVLVAKNRSAFSAAQHVRRERAARNHWPIGDQLDEARRLGELAASGDLALFIGAGTSIAAGLPTWNGLLTKLARATGVDTTQLGRYSALDQAQILETRFAASPPPGGMAGPSLGRAVCDAIGRPPAASLAHALLAGLGCREIVTTNYDHLYELAVEAQSGKDGIRVLPWQTVEPGKSWILKLHGDIDYPESIVLTRRHFAEYDSATRPAGSLLQALMLTKHLLVVGASLADDNVTRLALDVHRFRDSAGVHERIGTYLDVTRNPLHKELWGSVFRWVSFEGPSHDAAPSARKMEVFLDAVAAFASTDASWLLDPRFAGLLSDSARAVVHSATRVLADATASSTSEVRPLVSTLRSLGGTGNGS